MATPVYPGAIKTFTDKINNVDDAFASHINEAYAEIIAIETELGLIGAKKSVRCATTVNGALATAYANAQVIDGITLATNDRILIKDQTTGSENGIYTVNASGAPTRAVDMDVNAEAVSGLSVYVREGTVNAKTKWTLTNIGAITIGTTALVFEDALGAHKADTTAHAITKLNYVLPTVNLDYVGEIASEPMAISCAVTDVLYLSSTGYNKAKSDADATLPCVAMSVETGTGTRKILRRGFIKNTAWSFTVGNKLYVSTATAGAITATQPATIGNRVQLIGYAVTADTIYFNPNYVWVEV